MISNKTLISLAILKVNWDKYGKNYTENFVPIVIEVLKNKDIKSISLVDNEGLTTISELQKLVRESFGLYVPHASLKLILERLKRQGYLEKKYRTYHITMKEYYDYKIAKISEQVSCEHNAFIEKMLTFCNEEYGITWSKEEASEFLLAYLNEHAFEILKVIVKGDVVPTIGRSVKNKDFLISSFLKTANEKYPKEFSCLDTIVKGFILANALLYESISKIEKKYHKTYFFFDTGFLFQLLGFHGAPGEEAAKELIEFLYPENANLYVFPHTIDEMKTILSVCRELIEKSNYYGIGPAILPFFIANKYNSTDIALIIGHLEKRLKDFRIFVYEKPTLIAKYQLDENKLEDYLQRGVGYKIDSTRVKDVKSISAIFSLRQASDYNSLEDAPATFVTTNSNLVKASFDFLRLEYSFKIPLCITDYCITHLLWLKNPNRMPDLPKKKILALAYALLNPSHELWEKYCDETERLRQNNSISEEDYLLLRHSNEARTILMDITKGVVEDFTPNTFNEVLAKFNENKQEIRKKYRKEVEDHEETKKVLEEKKFKLLVYEQKISSIAIFFGRTIKKVLFIFYFSVLLIGMGFTFNRAWNEFLSKVSYSSLAYSVVFVCFLITIIISFIKNLLNTKFRKVEIFVAGVAEKILKKIFQ